MVIKFLSLIFIFTLFVGQINAQKKPVKKSSAKKGSSKKSSSKRTSSKVGTTAETEFEELSCYVDGACTFSIVKGDTLLYAVSGASGNYDFGIIPLNYKENQISDFNWYTSDGRKGHIVINTTGLKASKKYISMPTTGGELKLNDASFLWLTGANFAELSSKKMKITIDNKAQEDYYSPDEDAVTIPINYKGKALDLDGFIIQNKDAGAADRVELNVLNISYNLLIFKADYGNTTITLKEVREKKFVAAAATPIKKKK